MNDMTDAGGASPDVPAGFIAMPAGRDGFGALCGPFWMKGEGEVLVAGFRVEDRHCNPAGICHGGMLAMFSDFHLAMSAMFRHPLGARILPTINLSLDYLAPTPNGAWVEARAEIAKVTRGMVFASEIITADGQPVVRANGIFKILSESSAQAGVPAGDTGAKLRRYLERSGSASA